MDSSGPSKEIEYYEVAEAAARGHATPDPERIDWDYKHPAYLYPPADNLHNEEV